MYVFTCQKQQQQTRRNLAMKAVLLVLSCLQLVVGESLGGSLRVGKKVKPVDVLVLTEALW